MKHSIFSLLVVLSLSYSAVAATDVQVSTRAAEILDRAIVQEAALGKKQNARFFKLLRKRLDKVQLFWGMDYRGECKRSLEKTTFAYTRLDPQGHRWINFCPYAVDVLSHDQLSHVMVHELAHQLGVRDEGHAEFVADRAFNLSGLDNPFFIKSFSDFLDLIRQVNEDGRVAVKAIYDMDPTLEGPMAKAKEIPGWWADAKQAWDFRCYNKLDRSHAISKHAWLVLGENRFVKTRDLTR